MLAALRTCGRVYLRMIPVAYCGAFDYCLAAVLEFLVPRQDQLKGRPAKQEPCAKFYQIIIGCCKDEYRKNSGRPDYLIPSIPGYSGRQVFIWIPIP